jgi:ABC-2 type transport system permease protein
MSAALHWVVSPFENLFRYRILVFAFVKRDLSTRYRSSFFGWLWSLAQPLASILIFTAVFAYVFRVQPPPLGNGSGAGYYAIFMFTGLVAWDVFSGVINQSMAALVSVGDLLKKASFPSWAPVVGASIVQWVQVLLELVVLIAMLIFVRNWSWTWIAAIPVMVALFLFALGIGLMLAVANAHFGDVKYIVTVILGGLYFLTPVIYPISMVEQASPLIATIVMLNPMTWFVLSLQDALYALVMPTGWTLLALSVSGVATLWLGLRLFNSASRNLGEVL